MVESAVNAYAVTAGNAPATSPTPVAVVNDGTGDRQIVVLGAGDGTTTIVDGTIGNPQHINITGADYSTSTNNSSLSQLASGATFTGTIESVLTAPTAQVMMTSDQPMTIQVLQFIDLAGTHQIDSDTYVVAAGAGFNKNIVLPGNYIQIKVTNNGVSTTTTFDLSVTYGELQVGQPTTGQFSSAKSLSMVMSSDSGDQIITGQSSQTATINNILTPIAGSTATTVIGSKSGSVQVNSTGTAGAYVFEGSIDGTNFVAVPVQNVNLLSGAVINGPITATATNTIYTFPINFSYLRLRIVTAITGGSIQAFSRFSNLAFQTAKPVVSTDLQDSSAALAVKVAPATSWRATFAKAISTPGVDTSYFTLMQTGAGQSVSQSGGNLLLAAGTTAYSETVLRSVPSWQNAFLARWQTILSQRIANNNFIVELVDVIGDALAYTINSATSITVTFPSVNPFTSANVGQSVNIHSLTSASSPAGRYAIASVAGLTVTFTVAGFPASGSGTCSLTGWNYHQVIYTGTTATNATFDAQREGFNSGVTTPTINTTASPGHMGIIYNGTNQAIFSDALVASNVAYQFTERANRVVNIPCDDFVLYVQIRSLNGSTAPASTTTWTLGEVSVETLPRQAVQVVDSPQIGPSTSTGVVVQGTATVSVSNAPTIAFPTGVALADAFTNPTEAHLASDQMIFNGTSWDRRRSLGAVGAAATTGIAAAGLVGKAVSGSITATTSTYQTQAVLDLVGAQLVSVGGSVAVNLAAGAQGTGIKSGAGRLCRVIVVAAGTVATTIYDGTTNSGTVIGIVPAAAAAGSFYDFQMPCVTGIYAYAASGGAQLTISYT